MASLVYRRAQVKQMSCWANLVSFSNVMYMGINGPFSPSLLTKVWVLISSPIRKPLILYWLRSLSFGLIAHAGPVLLAFSRFSYTGNWTSANGNFHPFRRIISFSFLWIDKLMCFRTDNLLNLFVFPG